MIKMGDQLKPTWPGWQSSLTQQRPDNQPLGCLAFFQSGFLFFIFSSSSKPVIIIITFHLNNILKKFLILAAQKMVLKIT